MSLRRFVGYFFALSVCSTIAFASCIMGNTPRRRMPLRPSRTAPVISLVPVLKKRPARCTPASARCTPKPFWSPAPTDRCRSRAETILAFSCLWGYTVKSDAFRPKTGSARIVLCPPTDGFAENPNSPPLPAAQSAAQVPDGVATKCDRCGEILFTKDFEKNLEGLPLLRLSP